MIGRVRLAFLFRPSVFFNQNTIVPLAEFSHLQSVEVAIRKAKKCHSLKVAGTRLWTIGTSHPQRGLAVPTSMQCDEEKISSHGQRLITPIDIRHCRGSSPSSQGNVFQVINCRKELRRLRGLSWNIECILPGRSALKFSFQVVPGSSNFHWGIKALNPKPFPQLDSKNQ